MMWIMSFFPDFVTHLIVVVGILGIIITSVPLIWRLFPGGSAYQLVIQIASTILLGFGLYLEGGLTNEAAWKAKVSELEGKVAKLETDSAKVDTVVVTKVLIKKQIIKEKGATITEFIDREVKVYDNTCPIPAVVIKSHNAAALNDPLQLEIHTAAHNQLATPIKMAPNK